MNKQARFKATLRSLAMTPLLEKYCPDLNNFLSIEMSLPVSDDLGRRDGAHDSGNENDRAHDFVIENGPRVRQAAIDEGSRSEIQADRRSAEIRDHPTGRWDS